MYASESRSTAGTSRLFRPAEVAEILGVSTVTLAKHRAHGTGPAHLVLGPRTIRYREADLEAFLEAGRRSPAHQAA